MAPKFSVVSVDHDPFANLSDGRKDLTSYYNTQLSPEREAAFQKWVKANNREADLADYDLRGWFSADGNISGNGHFSDKYKKPNHPTFSNQSIYHGVAGNIGGSWGEKDNHYTFTPSSTNLANLGRKGLEQYFSRVEPDAKILYDPFADLPKGELGLSQGPMSFGDWLPFVREAVKQYAGEKIQGLKNALSLPGDVAQGLVDPNSQEGFESALGLAGLVSGGPMATPMKGPVARVGISPSEALQQFGKKIKEEKFQPKPADPVWLAELEKEMKELLADKNFSEQGGVETFKSPSGVTLAKSAAPKSWENVASVPARPPLKPLEEAFAPLNWQEQIHPEGIVLPTRDLAAQKRAEALGYNINYPLFKGIKPWAPLQGTGFWDVAAGSEPANFFSNLPHIAESYTGYDPKYLKELLADQDLRIGEVVPVVARPKSTLEINWKDVSHYPNYSSETMSGIARHGRAKNADMVVVRGLEDQGSPYPQDQFLVLNPNILRNPWADFSPAYYGSPDLLRSQGNPLMSVTFAPEEKRRGR